MSKSNSKGKGRHFNKPKSALEEKFNGTNFIMFLDQVIAKLMAHPDAGAFLLSFAQNILLYKDPKSDTAEDEQIEIPAQYVEQPLHVVLQSALDAASIKDRLALAQYSNAINTPRTTANTKLNSALAAFTMIVTEMSTPAIRDMFIANSLYEHNPIKYMQALSRFDLTNGGNGQNKQSNTIADFFRIHMFAGESAQAAIHRFEFALKKAGGDDIISEEVQRMIFTSNGSITGIQFVTDDFLQPMQRAIVENMDLAKAKTCLIMAESMKLTACHEEAHNIVEREVKQLKAAGGETDGKKFCTYCNYKGHVDEECRRKHPHLMKKYLEEQAKIVKQEAKAKAKQAKATNGMSVKPSKVSKSTVNVDTDSSDEDSIGVGANIVRVFERNRSLVAAKESVGKKMTRALRSTPRLIPLDGLSSASNVGNVVPPSVAFDPSIHVTSPSPADASTSVAHHDMPHWPHQRSDNGSVINFTTESMEAILSLAKEKGGHTVDVKSPAYLQDFADHIGCSYQEALDFIMHGKYDYDSAIARAIQDEYEKVETPEATEMNVEDMQGVLFFNLNGLWYLRYREPIYRTMVIEPVNVDNLPMDFPHYSASKILFTVAGAFVNEVLEVEAEHFLYDGPLPGDLDRSYQYCSR